MKFKIFCKQLSSCNFFPLIIISDQKNTNNIYVPFSLHTSNYVCLFYLFVSLASLSYFVFIMYSPDVLVIYFHWSRPEVFFPQINLFFFKKTNKNILLFSSVSQILSSLFFF